MALEVRFVPQLLVIDANVLIRMATLFNNTWNLFNKKVIEDNVGCAVQVSIYKPFLLENSWILFNKVHGFLTDPRSGGREPVTPYYS